MEETPMDDPPVETPLETPSEVSEVDQNNDNVKLEKLARQKARSSVAMRRGTTRVQSPFSLPQPSKVPFSKKTALEGHLERHSQKYVERAKDEQSIASVETSSDVYSVMSRSEMSESRKLRPSRPRRPKKYPPALFDHPPPEDHSVRQHEGRNAENESMRNVNLIRGDVDNVTKLSLERSQMQTNESSCSQQAPPSFRQKVKEQQKAHKRQVIQNLLQKEPQEPDGLKTEVGCSTPMSQMDQRRSRYNKVSSALQRKRFVIPPTKEKRHDMIEVTLTASDSASTNASPVSDSKSEQDAVVEQTKAGSRLAVMAAARRTKIQSSPSKLPDGTLMTVDSESLLTNASGRLSVFATPTRTKSRTDQIEQSFSSRSLDIDKRKFHGMSPSSSFVSRPDPPSIALASPSVTRSAALQRLSIDPALKRFQHPGRNSTGSFKGKQEEATTERSVASHRQDSPSTYRVPSLQATFSSHSESSSSYPKTSVGDVAVGDIIDVFLYRSSKKSSSATKVKTTQSSFKPDSGSRLSESGKVSRNNKMLARGSEKARKSLQASEAKKIADASPSKHGTDAFGMPFSNLTVSTAWESFS